MWVPVLLCASYLHVGPVAQMCKTHQPPMRLATSAPSATWQSTWCH
uniref:Uncharacterized protein n=1 Tax=Arundo donax TaxID=35708 RepID=A0A0A8ZI21_ARUDO